MNLLSRETSPYLLQHSDNPVDWFPWSEEAIEKAKQDLNQFFYRLAIRPVTGAMLWHTNPLRI